MKSKRDVILNHIERLHAMEVERHGLRMEDSYPSMQDELRQTQVDLLKEYKEVSDNKTTE